MRLPGLASGMDTENMIKEMMKPYTMRVDKMKQGTEYIKWQQDAYRNIMDGVSNITKKYFDVLNTDDYLLSSRNFSTLKPSGIPDTSNIKIDAGSVAVPGNYSLKVKELAAKAKVQGQSIADKVGNSKNVMNEKMSDVIDGEVKFTINGKEISYNFGDGGADRGKTIDEISKDISNKANVEFIYSEITGGFILRSKAEGANEKVTASDVSGDFLKNLFGKDTIDEAGKDAKFNITTPNGTATDMTKPTNNFTMDGVNYNIAGAKPEEEISFMLEGNSEEAFNKIKGFIDDYNKLVDELQGKLSEKKYRKFEPLTEEQKKDMKESDIKLWEEKAKSGILKGDTNIQNMLSTMRRAFFDSVEGAGLSLKDLGLTTSRDYTQGGKIVFDTSLDEDGNAGEARLKKLLKEDPNKVFNIFSKKSESYPSYSPDLTSTERKQRYNEEGILQRINDIFKDYTRTTKNVNGKMGIFVEKAGIKGTISEINNTLYKELEKKEKAIQEMEDKLVERENRYYSQFAQLEKYMNQMNSQSAWLAQQLGGGK
ncbi:flagellar filament capping protein FliD [Clostridium sp. LCP25S3_F8]|uniref:flagellar filament capping protein FliD n=1 Tax=Clostridium sp. LCP25S3_F8 TaxID=3438751 RepID=UPI003F93A7C4